MRPTSGTWLTVVQGEACNHLWHRMSCQKLCAHSFGSIGSWCLSLDFILPAACFSVWTAVSLDTDATASA